MTSDVIAFETPRYNATIITGAHYIEFRSKKSRHKYNVHLSKFVHLFPQQAGSYYDYRDVIELVQSIPWEPTKHTVYGYPPTKKAVHISSTQQVHYANKQDAIEAMVSHLCPPDQSFAEANPYDYLNPENIDWSLIDIINAHPARSLLSRDSFNIRQGLNFRIANHYGLKWMPQTNGSIICERPIQGNVRMFGVDGMLTKYELQCGIFDKMNGVTRYAILPYEVKALQTTIISSTQFLDIARLLHTLCNHNWDIYYGGVAFESEDEAVLFKTLYQWND